MVYYNEFDPKLAPWLYELMAAGAIAPGYVDTRSIEDVAPNDLRGFKQCHFFAGIGVWSYALRLAGWPDDRPVWTGSCPCQPFSAAGKGGGFDDERHLWPAWFNLIAQCRPGVVFGEQVAARDGLAWLDLVQSDLEAADYAVGPLDLCAAGFGAPHIRQRLFFVADDAGPGRRPERANSDSADRAEALRAGQAEPGRRGSPGRRADSSSTGLEGRDARALGDEREAAERGGEACGFWSPADWIECRDGKARPVEPGTFPLAHGAPARVVRLRGFGNAIVATVAAEFIKAYLSTT